MPHRTNRRYLALIMLLLSATAMAQFGAESARRTAENYLSFMAFSRQGLIEQLMFEGYAQDVATLGVDATDTDWFDQAARSAEQYLDMTGFSLTGLIDQLTFEGFTPDEARYGAQLAYGADVGLPPDVDVGDGGQAARSARAYLDFAAFSRQGLIDQLLYEGYTEAEATAGVDALDVDWNAQAVKSARTYLAVTSFSRQGLIDQLMFEGFTRAQATHGVNEVAR